MESGILPVRLFLDKSRIPKLLSCPISIGIFPCKLLTSIKSLSSFRSILSEDGNVPVKSLLYKSSSDKPVIFPICGGISPNNPFMMKLMKYIFLERRPIEEGKRPLRLLLPKSIRPRVEQLIRAVRMGKLVVLLLTR